MDFTIQHADRQSLVCIYAYQTAAKFDARLIISFQPTQNSKIER